MRHAPALVRGRFRWRSSIARVLRFTSAGGQVRAQPVELLGGSGFEYPIDLAGVGGHRAVAHAPVRSRLGTKPEHLTGALLDAAERLDAVRLVIAASVTQDDHGRAPVDQSEMALFERTKDPPVARVVPEAHHRAGRRGNRGRSAFSLEQARYFTEPLTKTKLRVFSKSSFTA